MLEKINWKALLIVVLFVVGGWVVIKFGWGKAEKLLNPADVKVGAYNFLTVGLMSMIFLIVVKFVFNKWQVPGLSTLVNMA